MTPQYKKLQMSCSHKRRLSCSYPIMASTRLILYIFFGHKSLEELTLFLAI